MGSFLTKCFVTQQTIIEDAPCVVFPIINFEGKSVTLEKGSKKSTYQNQESIRGRKLENQFLGLKFDAVGADCARQSLIDSELNRESLLIFFKTLQTDSFKSSTDRISFSFEDVLKNCPNILKYLSAKDQKSFKIQTIPWEEFQNTWEAIQDADKDSMVLISTIHSRKLPVQLRFAVCLKSTYDYCVKAQKNFRQDQRKIELSVPAIKKALKENSMLKQYPSMLSMDRNFKLNPDHMFSFAYLSYEMKIFDRYNDYKKEIQAENVLKTLKALSPIEDFLKFQNEIDDLETVIAPIQYGCQDYQNEYGDKFLKMVTHVNKDCAKFIKEKYED